MDAAGVVAVAVAVAALVVSAVVLGAAALVAAGASVPADAVDGAVQGGEPDPVDWHYLSAVAMLAGSARPALVVAGRGAS
jgi:DNA-binding transcriptional regulator YdaS (Cro superfamily)